MKVLEQQLAERTHSREPSKQGTTAEEMSRL